MREITPGVWLQEHRFAVLGAQLGKRTTVLRLADGRLLVHSAGPFGPAELSAIRALGPVGWLMEATCFHDTFAARAAAAFPGVPYLVPPRFPVRLPGARPLASLPPELAAECDLLELRGQPRLREHALLHRPSRTLIVADLVFHLPARVSWWTRLFVQGVSGVRPGTLATSRLFRAAVRDRAAFARSVETLLSWDFTRLIVGHGDPVLDDAPTRLRAALAWARDSRPAA